ncbi:MAG TPA: C10 family peptidase [Bacteroidales bacterium]|nr:C10 family peptidase [Bacteroidales bacterium]
MKQILKGISIFIFSLLAIPGVFAEKIEPKIAQALATNFFYEKCLLSGCDIRQPAEMTLNYTRLAGNEEVYYVFSSGKNFIIVAADDDVYPVLAYSFESSYRQENQSPEFEFWMSSYEKQILQVRKNSIKADQKISTAWDFYLNHFNPHESLKGGQKSMAPLLLSTWDQGNYYNSLCPEDPAGPGGRVWSGCVATCMAQVIYYYRYPQQGIGSHGYYSDYGYLSADFGTTTYNYDGMQNDIMARYNYDMALIQYHCGIAIDMQYSPSGSGAFMDDDANAMKNNFGYSSSTQLFYKDDYTATDWANMLKNNLDAKMPIQYAGYGDGGHAFVCDGYQGTDFFHFNWGWGGTYNGYFYLDNLNPGYTFNNGHQAILNSYPATGFPQSCTGIKTINNTYGTIEDGSSPKFDYQNNMDCMWLIAPADSIEYIRIVFDRLNTEAANDIITIYDGETTADSVLGVFSGNTIPPEIKSTSTKVLVRFTTNGTNVADGWLLSFNSKETRFCNNLTELTATSGVISDGSGSYNYNNGTVCRWRIRPPATSAVTINFNSFDLAADADFIKAYDEAANTELITFQSGSLPQTFTAYTGDVLLLFLTNAMENAGGWELSYTTTPLSVNEVQKGYVNLFPNPATDYFKVQASVPEAPTLTLEIYNNLGAKVISKQVTATNDQLDETIDISDLSKGMYVLKITSEKFNHTQKLAIR